jgi:anti-sigma-K factor RskA
MLPDGGAPRSLGLIPASGVERVALPAPAGTALQNISNLAVSLEPAGGSTTGAPTGPVLYTGRVERTY